MLRITQLSGFGAGASEAFVVGRVVAGGGSYGLIGAAASILKSGSKTLTAAGGSYSYSGTAAGVTKSTSAEATAFLARTTGLDGTHTAAYTALINGLVADGVWAKLDVLHIYATQDTATAQLNLVSSSYPATLNGTPTFTADRGYTGTTSSTTKYINTGFNPTTAPSPKYTLNSAHLSSWCLTSGSVNADSVGVNNLAHILHRWSTNTFYASVNSPFGGLTLSGATDGTGFMIANRSASNALQAYKNGAAYHSSSTASTSIPNLNMYSIGNNNGGTAQGAGIQQTMISIGSSLNSTEAGNFYSRLRTYMTAVGVP